MSDHSLKQVKKIKKTEPLFAKLAHLLPTLWWISILPRLYLSSQVCFHAFFETNSGTFLLLNNKMMSSKVLRCLLCWLLLEKTLSRPSLSLFLTAFLPLYLIVHSTTLWKCIEMRACMLLYLLCACDAIRSPLLSIICGVSVPHSARPQWGYFSQPSIQTWPITARLQSTFCALRSSQQWMVDISNHSAVNPSVR